VCFSNRWNFAQANNIVLTDEYDQISKDLESFWALEPHDLRHRAKVMQEREHTFTLSIDGSEGVVSRHGPHPDLQRAKDMQDLLQSFARFVPDQVNMTFIIDDQPAVMMPWNQKEKMLELASQGECECIIFPDFLFISASVADFSLLCARSLGTKRFRRT
jgi:hypothetical protein